jgi:hypothetical protein
MSAAVPYRLLPPAQTLLGSDGTALENVIIEPLPDGALCFVNDQEFLYSLRKFSLEAVSFPTVIATSEGAGVRGRWMQQSSGSMGPTGPTGPEGSGVKVGGTLGNADANIDSSLGTKWLADTARTALRTYTLLSAGVAAYTAVIIEVTGSGTNPQALNGGPAAGTTALLLGFGYVFIFDSTDWQLTSTYQLP